MSQLSFLEQLARERRALTVSEFTARIKALVETEFFQVWIEGEISNFKRHSSGHWYFSLKDEAASLRCASYRMQNRLIRFQPDDGLHVRARGRITIYEPRGEYQLIVEHLEPVGLGALQLAFDQLKSRLAAEGLFESSRKRPLPLLPRCVGVVTSPTGAALRDILRVIRRRNQALNILISPARVQGEGAAIEIVRALKLLNFRKDVDVIILGRGGGSIEDLWSFNEEAVARAICGSRVPVISAVGHETDFTIADFVADLRASTPSAAAELVAAALGDLNERVRRLAGDLVRSIGYKLNASRNLLDELERSRGFEAVRARIDKTSQRLDDALGAIERVFNRRLKSSRSNLDRLSSRLSEADLARALSARRNALYGLNARLQSSLRERLRSGGEQVSIAAGKLNSLSPLAVLGRGYAIAFDARGRVIKRAADVGRGDRLRVRVDEGDIDCIKE
jgi:exodeoxyribonuclease VII large subunit